VTEAPLPRRAFAGFLLATLLMQSAWILTVPAFRGIDEFDHVYQAAAVARGQWAAHDPALNGRGGIVTIPASIVRAASPVCQTYKYVGHDNCFPIRGVSHGQAQVATAAGAYNPVYYLIVGTVARPFGGAAADYAMRIVTAVMCALLVAWAATVTARWASTAWPLVTLAIALTPVLVYSTAMTAPNGITYASAILVWAAAMGLVRTEVAGVAGRHLAVPLTVGSIALVATHTSGAMWLALSALVVVTLRPAKEWVRLLVAHRTTWLLASGLVVAAIVACITWIRVEHTNELNTKVLEDGQFPWTQLPIYHMLWALQALGAFPLRNEPAPAPVYVIWGLLLIGVLVALFRWGSVRERMAGAATLFMLVLVPTVLTVVSYRTEGLAWQGRYALPLWVGVVFLAGLALDRHRARLPLPNAGLLVAMLATAMTISTVHVGLREIAHGATEPAAAGFTGGMVLVGVLAALGALVPLAVLTGTNAEASTNTEAHQPTSIRT
jgi:hypothetical protein